MELEPGTNAWWAWRPLWLILFVVALVPLVLIFVGFEAGSRAKGMAPPGPAQSICGALVTCGGLVMMAMSGIGADNALGFNWIAVLLVVLGVAVATSPLPQRMTGSVSRQQVCDFPPTYTATKPDDLPYLGVMP